MPTVIAEMQCGDADGAYSLDGRYHDLMAKHGACMLLIQPNATEEETRAALSLADGVMILGGDDIDPAMYRQERQACTQPALRVRDEFEPMLIRLADEMRIPYLGICRGCQMLAVANGGTLMQSLPSTATCHDHKPYTEHAHCVHIVPDTQLAMAFRADARRGDTTEASANAADITIDVNSAHHQAIATIPSCLRVAARADDGTIEAICGTDSTRFCVGVQWHPECLPDDTATGQLIDAFVTACRRHMDDTATGQLIDAFVTACRRHMDE